MLKEQMSVEENDGGLNDLSTLSQGKTHQIKSSDPAGPVSGGTFQKRKVAGSKTLQSPYSGDRTNATHLLGRSISPGSKTKSR